MFLFHRLRLRTSNVSSRRWSKCTRTTLTKNPPQTAFSSLYKLASIFCLLRTVGWGIWWLGFRLALLTLNLTRMPRCVLYLPLLFWQRVVDVRYTLNSAPNLVKGRVYISLREARAIWFTVCNLTNLRHKIQCVRLYFLTENSLKSQLFFGGKVCVRAYKFLVGAVWLCEEGEGEDNGSGEEKRSLICLSNHQGLVFPGGEGGGSDSRTQRQNFWMRFSLPLYLIPWPVKNVIKSHSAWIFFYFSIPPMKVIQSAYFSQTVCFRNSIGIQVITAKARKRYVI